MIRKLRESSFQQKKNFTKSLVVEEVIAIRLESAKLQILRYSCTKSNFEQKIAFTEDDLDGVV